jgi:hypothetical protein
MGYDPSSNELRRLENEEDVKRFVRDTPQFLFTVNEQVTVKGVVFRVHEIDENRLILKPVKAA